MMLICLHEYINVPYMPMYTNTIFSYADIYACVRCTVRSAFLPPASVSRSHLSEWFQRSFKIMQESTNH